MAEQFDVLYRRLPQNGVPKIEVIVESFGVEFQIAVVDYIVDIVASNPVLLVIKNWPRSQPIGFKSVQCASCPLSIAVSVHQRAVPDPAPPVPSGAPRYSA